MLSKREMYLMYLFTGLEKKEYRLLVYLLMHGNCYEGTYTRLAQLMEDDNSNIRKLVLSMVKKQYLVMVKDGKMNERKIAISPVVIDYINEC